MPALDPGPFARFLARALGALAGESPAWHAEVAAAVGPSGIAMDVDGEAFRLRFEGAALHLDGATHAAGLEVRTGRATILALAEGDLSLVAALESDRLFVRGALAAVLRFDTALLAFLEGAVRAPSLAPMLDRLRENRIEH